METRGILQEGPSPDSGLALASAVDAFAKCLEDSACRRGEAAPFGPRDQGASLGARMGVGVGLGEREGPGTGIGMETGDLLLPSEILCAIREANGICIGYDDKMMARRLWGMDETGQQGIQEVVHFCGAPCDIVVSLLLLLLEPSGTQRRCQTDTMPEKHERVELPPRDSLKFVKKSPVCASHNEYILKYPQNN